MYALSLKLFSCTSATCSNGLGFGAKPCPFEQVALVDEKSFKDNAYMYGKPEL